MLLPKDLDLALRTDGKYYHLGIRKDKKMIYLNTKSFTLDKAVKPKKVGTTRKTHQIIKERGKGAFWL